MSMMQNRRRKATINSFLYGAASIALYATVFSHADQFVHFIAKGGIRAIIPVATVFLFSWIHGSFSSNVWTALGIEASGKTTAKVTEKSKVSSTRKTQVRAQQPLNA